MAFRATHRRPARRSWRLAPMTLNLEGNMASPSNRVPNDGELDGLSPLVKKGESRDAVLTWLVDRWCRPFHDGDAVEDANASGWPIENKNFIDANNGENIDLGEILRRVNDTFRDQLKVSEDRLVSRPTVIIRNCRVNLAKLDGIEILATFIAHRVKFGNSVSFKGTALEYDTSFGFSWFSRGTCFERAIFGDETDFYSAQFEEQCSFRGARFGHSANFKNVTFGNESIFSSSEFGDDALFTNAKFGRHCRFMRAKFGENAHFSHAEFGSGCSFAKAVFDYNCAFDGTRFDGNTSFQFAEFGPETLFTGANLGECAWFANTTFGNFADFRHATFGQGASFQNATFGRNADFREAKLGDWANFHCARFGPGGGIGNARHSLKTTGWRRLLSPLGHFLEWYNWSRTASFGRIQILTRVSYFALLIVPVIAGVWPAVRVAVHSVAFDAEKATGRLRAANQRAQEFIASMDANVPFEGNLTALLEEVETSATQVESELSQFQQSPHHMPTGLVLAFFSALCVALGHLIYQVGADERVRADSETGYRRDRNSEFRDAHEHQRKDLLLRTFGPLHRLAELTPGSRNSTLVRHHDRLVWLPESIDRLNTLPASTQDESDAHLRADDQSDSEAWTEDAEVSEQLQVEHLREELELILVDEGASAEYQLFARQNMWAAYASGMLYLAAAFLIAWLIALQAGHVLRAGGIDV
jgi:hypothetical protein